MSDRSTAIVHEWIADRTGSEKVFERIASLFPAADLYAMTAAPEVRIDVQGRSVETTFLDRAFFRDHRAIALPLMPAAWRSLRRGRRYDVAITSAHAFAREFVNPRAIGVHLCYVHAPMRYAWERETDPRTANRLAALPAAALRRLDARSVPDVHSFAVNSRETQDRVRRHYRRDSIVINPPVDTQFFQRAVRHPDGSLLAFGRFVDYKRFDLAVAVADRLGMRLVIAGSGPHLSRIRRLCDAASVPIRIVVRPTDDELLELLARASVLVFPGVEDFGIVPVEAQAAGVPVVGPALGGLLDTVDDGVTGCLVHDQSVEALADGVKRAIINELGGQPCRTWTHQFRPERFDQQIREWVGLSTE